MEMAWWQLLLLAGGVIGLWLVMLAVLAFAEAWRGMR